MHGAHLQPTARSPHYLVFADNCHEPIVSESGNCRRAAIVWSDNCLESRCFEVSDVSELVYKVSELTGQVLVGRH